MIDAILRDLQRPEYVHVLINPLPVYGLAIALFGLIAAMYLGTRSGQVTALVLIFACAASAWPVAQYGDAAEDRVLAMADDDGQAWLKAHAHRADDLIYVFYALALVSAAAIFAPKKWPKTARPLLAATLILAVASLGAGGYIAYAGGKIRHKEFRSAPPPKTVEAEPD
jgi:alpha-D-ribose 1-methylphosphonate 5-triphosphate synthase subunit PhnH